jgi:hypothetical protein
MLFPWFQISMLAYESGNVIALRLAKCSAGDGKAVEECGLMVSEKVRAAFEAGMMVMAGGSASAVIDRYREYVASNVKRLS